jgi:rhodanese-related sulfurtransferase
MGLFNKITTVFMRGGAGGDEALPEAKKAILMEKVRQSDLFKDLPGENIEDMLSHMETLKKKTGDVIIREGDEGDYYYLLAEGTANVERKSCSSGKTEVVAQLNEPTGFGEEALISNAKRNATISMTSDGAVMRLSKDDFEEYVKEPMITWYSAAQAQKEMTGGARWIDVRDHSESEHSHLHGALLICMKELRERVTELEKDILYICYCDNGRLSSTAAFLLRQRGYNVGVLRGGLLALKRAGIA